MIVLEQKKFVNIKFLNVMEYSLSNYNAPGYFVLQIPKPYKNIFLFFWYRIYFGIRRLFSIGELSPEFNNKDAIKKVNALPCKNDFGNIKVNHERTTIISPVLGIIVSSGDYRTKIKKIFLKKWLEINAKKINMEIIIIMNAKKILIYHLLNY